MTDRTQISGIFPHLALKAELGPPRSECGVGGLMPFAGRLWAITYLSHTRRTGSGTGLYEIDDDFNLTKRPESTPGTYANRFVHYPSNQLFIGPHVIDADRNIRTINELVDIRLTATATHLHEPDRLVYLLGMEGELYEVDVNTLEVTYLDDLVERLGVKSQEKAHFKAAYAQFGRLVVANNCYLEEDWQGERADGRLAEWDGENWTILEHNPFVEVTGRGKFAPSIFATGWDRASVLLHVYTANDDKWTRYRLPKATHCMEHAWQTEWPRIRETEHERFLMDVGGMYYELSPWVYNNRIWGIRPISTHLWINGDFCSWNGMLVIGADNASPAHGQNPFTGEPVSGLWFGKTDDLWQYGKPKGWGGPWWKQDVKADQPSDPYLMTGFEHKHLHLTHTHNQPVTFQIELDVLGDGSWTPYQTLEVAPGSAANHVFPTGLSAHWVRLTPDTNCNATGYFTYT